MLLTVAYSPCPNDTFMFHDLAEGLVCVEGCQVQTHLHDVETLNQRALEGLYDVTKVSFPAYLRVRGEYRLLSAGAAVGFGCGPVVVARPDVAPSDLAGGTVAVPGELTTAFLLFRLWSPQARRFVQVRYDRIMGMVARGEVDGGVLIHEGRFVYRTSGLKCVADLGQWWEEQTHLPIPLGCVIARRSLGQEMIHRLEQALRQAIRNSQAHPEGTWEYVRRHAQETDQDTLVKHVRMFVNDFSVDLGPTGLAAVEKLEELARGAGVIP